MPENKIPATKPDSPVAPGEFDFAQAPTENPRIKRRSLKAKGSTLKPAGGAPPAARELEKEAPPLSSRQPSSPPPEVAEKAKPQPAAKTTETPVAPPRTVPSTQAATPSQPASGTVAFRSTATPTTSSTTSPHGTRPATLYYSSQPRKAETPAPAKTIPAEPAASPEPTATTPMPTSFTRPATSASPTRPATTSDYRANIERQSREQKSVGNLLSYIVYGFIILFVLVVGLAGYGADVIFKQLHDESATVSDLDARYSAANKDLNAKLATTQDTLNTAQATINRQQDVILKQQEELNRLISATSDNAAAIKAEKQARAQETANLRGQVRDLENKGNTPKL